MFESLKQLPQDPILQLMQMFRDDIGPTRSIWVSEFTRMTQAACVIWRARYRKW
ncbi:MAG: hypothetical protein MH208_11115 [Marinobacter sp.]|nr:hypothetical protein [Marinobacter sp.]